MNYQRIYNTIIERGKKRTLLEYTEEHHIVPRCLGGADDKSNLVDLTPEEHYVCHQILVKMYPDNIRLVSAAMFMVANGMNRRSNKSYGWLRRKWAEHMTGPNNPAKLNGPWNKGISGYKNKVNFSNESIKLFSERMKKNNPCAGVKPWNHPRATVVTKGIWARADEIYNVWLANNKPSYCKLFGLCMNKKYDWKNDGKEVGPFMNLVKYFRTGWAPTEDLEWKELKEKL
jgi:hypothetical protein